MFGYIKREIADNERALLWNRGRFEMVVGPGTFRRFDPYGRLRLEVFDITRERFEHPRMDFILAADSALIERYFQIVDLSANELALIYRNGKLAELQEPASRRVYWRGPVERRVDCVDISTDYVIDQAVLCQLTDVVRSSTAVVRGDIPARHRGLLFVDGDMVATLDTGVYGYWGFGRDIQMEVVDLRVQEIEVSGQEILTKDKVSLRANLSAVFRVSDPVIARTELKRYQDALYRELQFGLRQAIGTRTLDVLLGAKETLDGDVFDFVHDRMRVYGIELIGVGVKDLILPGDMKTILNQVVEAEKAAQAAVIRRREETNATRSQLNTAKLMADNPTLMRLKELEALEKVTDKIGQMTVFGGLDGVMNELVKLRA